MNTTPRLRRTQHEQTLCHGDIGEGRPLQISCSRSAFQGPPRAGSVPLGTDLLPHMIQPNAVQHGSPFGGVERGFVSRSTSCQHDSQTHSGLSWDRSSFLRMMSPEAAPTPQASRPASSVRCLNQRVSHSRINEKSPLTFASQRACYAHHPSNRDGRDCNELVTLNAIC